MKILITILRYVAILPVILIVEIILRGTLVCIFPPSATNGLVNLYHGGNDALVWLVYFAFAIVETAVFVKTGTFIAPQKGKRVVSILLATIRCLGNMAMYAQLKNLETDILYNVSAIDYLPVIVSSAVAIGCIYNSRKAKKSGQSHD